MVVRSWVGSPVYWTLLGLVLLSMGRFVFWRTVLLISAFGGVFTILGGFVLGCPVCLWFLVSFSITNLPFWMLGEIWYRLTCVAERVSVVGLFWIVLFLCSYLTLPMLGTEIRRSVLSRSMWNGFLLGKVRGEKCSVSLFVGSLMEMGTCSGIAPTPLWFRSGNVLSFMTM